LEFIHVRSAHFRAGDRERFPRDRHEFRADQWSRFPFLVSAARKGLESWN
jgi:hypothetical protein